MVDLDPRVCEWGRLLPWWEKLKIGDQGDIQTSPRGVFVRRRQIPPVRARRGLTGLPSKALYGARTGGGLVKDEDEAETATAKRRHRDRKSDYGQSQETATSPHPPNGLMPSTPAALASAAPCPNATPPASSVTRFTSPTPIFRMVRNHTPRGKAYNPYEATFRIPPSVTKTDVRSYLWTAYGVKTTYIRTANYISPLRRTQMGLRPVGSHRTYKRAVVGLVDPFYYPQDMEDMDKLERKKREKWLEERFALKLVTRMRRHELIRMSQSGSKTWRLTGHVRRDKILQSIAKRRALDARASEQVESKLAERRAAGHPILRNKGAKSKKVLTV
ncbi:hypothetical protein JVU11DRAFT_10475, partial [Chiua virens]